MEIEINANLVTILKGSFIQDIDVEDGRFRHPGDLEDPDVRLQDIIKGWVNGHGIREPGDGRRETAECDACTA
jgi:hypothetical protein